MPNTDKERVRGYKDEIMSYVLLELIPMGKCESECKCRSEDLYF